MAGNGFNNMPDGELKVRASTTAAALVASPTTYGITSGDATALNTAAEDFGLAYGDVEPARFTYRSIVEVKDEARALLLEKISLVVGKVYAADVASDAELLAAGLEPRSTSRSPVEPKQPLMISATPYQNGTVQLAWDRSGNPYSVTFVVQAKAEGASEWQIVGSTTKSRITLSGYAPGEMFWFRVYGERSGRTSEPADPIAIYSEGGDEIALSVAA